MKIGLIGLDTSHAVAFTELLQNEQLPDLIRDAKISCAFPGGSSHPFSQSRIQKFTENVQAQGIPIVSSIEEVAQTSDAILLLSVDGGQHVEQFSKIAPFGKPVFIDKPLALSVGEAEAIFKLANDYNIPIMTSSALRFAEDVRRVPKQTIVAVDCYGPMPKLSQWDYFWYGIHTVEMLFSWLGPGYKQVERCSISSNELFIATWYDGRTATIRGHKTDNSQFGATIHYADKSVAIQVQHNSKPYYASLLEEVIYFFKTGISPIDEKETMEIIRFIEEMNS